MRQTALLDDQETNQFVHPLSRLPFLRFGRGRGLLLGIVFAVLIAARFEGARSGDDPHRASLATHDVDNRLMGQKMPFMPSDSHIAGTPRNTQGTESAEERLGFVATHLLRSMDHNQALTFSFFVDETTPTPSSYSYADGRVIVTLSMCDALKRDAWLATILAYEIGHVLRERQRDVEIDLDPFAIRLLAQAGYDPREVAKMGDWITSQTSLANQGPARPTADQFSQSIARKIEQVFPQGVPGGLLR